MELWEREKYTAIAIILGVLLSVGAIFYFRGNIPFAIEPEIVYFSENFENGLNNWNGNRGGNPQLSTEWKTDGQFSLKLIDGDFITMYRNVDEQPLVPHFEGKYLIIDAKIDGLPGCEGYIVFVSSNVIYTAVNLSIGQYINYTFPLPEDVQRIINLYLYPQSGCTGYFDNIRIAKGKTAFKGNIYWNKNFGLCPRIGAGAWLINKNYPSYFEIINCSNMPNGYCADSDKNQWYINLNGVPKGEYSLWLSCLSGSSTSYLKIIPITVETGKTKNIDWWAQEDEVCIDGICPIQPPPEEQVDALIRMLIQQIIQQICESNPYICNLIVIKEGKYPINPCLGDYNRLNVNKNLDIYRALYISNPDYAKIEAGAEPIYDYGNIYSTYYVPQCIYMGGNLQCYSLSRQGYTENWTSKWWCISVNYTSFSK